VRSPRPPNRVEIWLGRSLALWAHPFVAWRLSPPRVRAGIVAGYVAAGYVAGFALLLFLA
jgi:hypothetical protein